MKALFLLGRAVFGGYFLYNAMNHFQNYGQLTQYAKSKNVPLPGAAVPATGALLAIGGASLMLGIKPKYGSLAIMGFLAGVSPMMHDFWRQDDPGQRQAEMINFSKNMALLGSALALGNTGKSARAQATGKVTERLSNLKQMPVREQNRKYSHRRAA